MGERIDRAFPAPSVIWGGWSGGAGGILSTTVLLAHGEWYFEGKSGGRARVGSHDGQTNEPKILLHQKLSTLCSF